MPGSSVCVCVGCATHAGTCGMPTLNGSRCVPCNRGFRRAVHNPAYDQPAWRKRSKRDIAEHVARSAGDALAIACPHTRRGT